MIRPSISVRGSVSVSLERKMTRGRIVAPRGACFFILDYLLQRLPNDTPIELCDRKPSFLQIATRSTVFPIKSQRRCIRCTCRTCWNIVLDVSVHSLSLRSCRLRTTNQGNHSWSLIKLILYIMHETSFIWQFFVNPYPLTSDSLITEIRIKQSFYILSV